MNDTLEAQLAAASAVPDDAALVSVRDLALRLVNDTAALELLKDEVAERERALKDLAERQLPERCASVGLSAVPLTNGAVVEIKPFVGASIEKEKQDAAYAWLAAVGAGDLVKNVVTLTFARGEDALADFICRVALSHGLSAEQKKAVNYQTLQGWVRERLKNGEDMNAEVISVYAGQVAKIRLPKGATLAGVLGEKS